MAYIFQELASATHTVNLLVDRLGTRNLHFEVMDLIPDLHVLKHVTGQLCFERFDFGF